MGNKKIAAFAMMANMFYFGIESPCRHWKLSGSRQSSASIAIVYSTALVALIGAI